MEPHGARHLDTDRGGGDDSGPEQLASTPRKHVWRITASLMISAEDVGSHPARTKHVYKQNV